MSEEEKEAIEHFKKYENKLVYEINEKDKKCVKTLLNYIDKLEKENRYYKLEELKHDSLELLFKESLNNIGVEVEIAWRKFEKLEN